MIRGAHIAKALALQAAQDAAKAAQAAADALAAMKARNLALYGAPPPEPPRRKPGRPKGSTRRPPCPPNPPAGPLWQAARCGTTARSWIVRCFPRGPDSPPQIAKTGRGWPRRFASEASAVRAAAALNRRFGLA